MNNVLSQVMVLFIIMAVGYAARKFKLLNGAVNKGLSDLLIYITLPCTIIISFQFSFSRKMFINSQLILLYSFIMYIVLIIISKFLFIKCNHESISVLRYVTIFSNSGYMGYPVLLSVYGKIGLFYAAIISIPFNLFMWSVGILLFTGGSSLKDLKKAVINPGIISIFIGFIFFMFSVHLPSVIYKTFDTIGNMTTPLSMIIVGSMLAECNGIETFKDPSVYYASFIRLIAEPACVLVVLRLLGVKGIILGVMVLTTAMPAAANTAIFAEKFNGDTKLSSKNIFISTLLSIFTIPIFLGILTHIH